MAKLKDSYARALLEISEEQGTMSKDLEQAIFIKNALDSKSTITFLMNPGVSDSQKFALFDNIFSDRISEHMKNSLYLMVQNGHGSQIVPALDEYIERAKRRVGVLEAKVVSAIPLTDEQVESIRDILRKKTHMDIEISYDVDPDIIGGFYVMVGDRVFDATVRSEMIKMKESLKRGSSEW
ncbi:MAG TPA: ATP synthase F1 subunit delta [Clostridia bacterium]|nr:ATP synthase F1 subunit delta [Clostridia bacterium]